MDDIYIKIPGKPQGKERPRFNSQTKHTYTPAKTATYEALIKQIYIEKYGVQCFAPNGSVMINIIATFEPPKSVSAQIYKKMLLGVINPTKNPDIDNIAKIVLDGLNGIAYKDDAQVTFIAMKKRYGVESMVEVLICKGENND